MVIVDNFLMGGGAVASSYVTLRQLREGSCTLPGWGERVSYVTFAKMKRSIPSGAQGRKRRKEEEEKKAKFRGKSITSKRNFTDNLHGCKCQKTSIWITFASYEQYSCCLHSLRSEAHTSELQSHL